jgi:hypothetical protein
VHGRNLNEEKCAILGHDAAYIGNSLKSQESFWILEPFPETSVRNYHYTLCNSLEERSSHLLLSGSLKSRNLNENYPKFCARFVVSNYHIIVFRRTNLAVEMTLTRAGNVYGTGRKEISLCLLVRGLDSALIATGALRSD